MNNNPFDNRLLGEIQSLGTELELHTMMLEERLQQLLETAGLGELDNESITRSAAE